jgi:hypothetical protein
LIYFLASDTFSLGNDDADWVVAKGGVADGLAEVPEVQ